MGHAEHFCELPPAGEVELSDDQQIDAGNSFSLPSSSRPSPHNGHVGESASSGICLDRVDAYNLSASLIFSPVDPNILVSGCKSSSAGAVVAIWDLSSLFIVGFVCPS